MVGDLSKKYPADLFRSEKIVQGYTWGKIYFRLKKISLVAYNAGKKSYAVLYRGKNSISRGLGKKLLPKPNHPYFSSKVDPFARLNHFLILGYAR